MGVATVVVENGPTWTDVGLFVVGVLTLLLVIVGARITVNGVYAARDQLLAATEQLKLVETSTALETMSFLAGRWESEMLMRARQLVNQVIALDGSSLAQRMNHWDRTNSTEYFEMSALLGFFEELGYLCQKEGNMDTVKDYVEAVFKAPVQYYFGLFREYIEEVRENSKNAEVTGNAPDAQFGEFFEALGNELGK